MVKKYDKDDISPCPKCHSMTKSIRLSRAKYKCEKCGSDKSLSDVFFYEAIYKEEDLEEKE
jgi:ribosomal protein L37AE/L43A